ncbi:MAG: primosomal protein N' [Butyrivibrio sp.]|nr:primosomal protein N' [Butyrivibrio sp.]
MIGCPENALYANIIIDISHEKVDRPFQYLVPQELRDKVSVGSCVEVPFGKGNTLRKGFVIELTDKAEYDRDRIKAIAAIALDINPAQEMSIRLAAWIRQHYGSTMIAALKTVLPANKKQKALQYKYISLKMPVREATEYYYECIRKKYYARERLLKELLEDPEERIQYEIVTGKLNVASQTIKAMSDKGIINIETESVYRNPVSIKKDEDSDKKLSIEQQAIVDTVISDYDEGKRDVYLIHGITGSGKTEVYISIIKEIIKKKKQAIVLIPEIALTYQTLKRFYRHFGDRVSVMNSTLSVSEKYDQMQRAKNGEIDVIIGPRSALFTPFPNIGVIIMDEEHETSYKSETMPKYHAREVAIALAKMVPEGASVVLGSATPSLESYYKAQTGEYQLFKLNRRLTGGTLPNVEVVDLRDELKSGNRSIFSRSLQEKIEDRLQKHEQIMLFINRRGLAGFVSCRSCGYVFKCPHCDVPLSEHRGGKLVCHYCGYEQSVTKICPKCGSKYVSAFRAGTEQIENEVYKLFPQAKVLRMDADTTKTKHSYEEILSAFANMQADVLVGTQMIVKGHDFPNVTLVGILAADMSLYASDYRAGERTFQLLTQAAGRAGRGEKEGSVIIQTYQPEHYSIQTAAKQDYIAFYNEEIAYRKLLMYPPMAHMMAIQIWARSEDNGIAFANYLRALIERMKVKDAVVIGPAAAAISRIKDEYRMAIYIKMKDYEGLIGIREKIDLWLEKMTNDGRMTGLTVQFDFDPVNGF